jgi:hypothetical protein
MASIATSIEVRLLDSEEVREAMALTVALRRAAEDVVMQRSDHHDGLLTTTSRAAMDRLQDMVEKTR